MAGVLVMLLLPYAELGLRLTAGSGAAVALRVGLLLGVGGISPAETAGAPPTLACLLVARVLRLVDILLVISETVGSWKG
jgi:hypothetical protein